MQKSYEQDHLCERRLPADEYEKIDVFCHTVNIHVSTSDARDIGIAWVQSSNWDVDVDKQGACLVLTEKDVIAHMGLHDLLFSKSEMDLYIEIPKEYRGALRLETANGNIDVRGLEDLSHVDFQTGTGCVTVQGLYTRDGFVCSCSNGSLDIRNVASKGPVWLSTGAGSIRAQNVATDENCTVVCLSGKCTIHTLQAAGRLAAESNTGVIALSNVRTDSMTTKISGSGMMEIDGLYADNCIRIHTASGGVRCTVDDDIGEYTAYCRSNYGNCNVPDVTGKGPKTLHIMTNTGHVQVNFSGRMKETAFA